MINTLSRETPVIVQGITGRMGRTHAALMRAYGTKIVGGTSTRTAFSSTSDIWRRMSWRDAATAVPASKKPPTILERASRRPAWNLPETTANICKP